MPTKFDFVSPGIQLREIDQSQVTLVPEEDGLLLIGRSRKGPSMKPVKVNSLENFLDVFGKPMDGVKANDPWREGNTGAPSYAGYAAQAYLAAAVGPVKFIRLGGLEAAGATGTNKAGWNVPQYDFASAITSAAGVESAVGIFVGENKAAVGATGMTATLTIVDETAFLITSTITIEFPGGSHVFTTTAAATGGLNIDHNLITTAGSATVAALEIRTQIDTYLGTLVTDAEKGVSIDLTAGPDLVFTQLTLGTAAVAGTRTAAIQDAGASNNASVTFSGGTNTALAVPAVLAGVLYMSASNITLTGTGRLGGTITAGQGATAIVRSATTLNWTAEVSGSTTTTEEISFNFDPASKDFIRNVFNTDPTEFTAGTGDYNLNYFLGETFEHAVNRLSATNGLFAFTAAIISGSEGHFTDYQKPLAPAKSGWFIGKKAAQKKLFRLVALEDGADFNKSYVVRVKDLRLATALKPNATFSIEIAGVGMKASEYVEKYSNLTLNPNDPNYIAKRIGDAHQSWSVGKSKVVTTGIYNNISNLVRVEMSTANLNASDIPVGFVGPRTYLGQADIAETSTLDSVAWIRGKNQLPQPTPQADTINELIPADTLNVTFPKYGLSVANTSIRGGNYISTALLGLSYAAQKGDENFGDLGLLRADDLFDPHLSDAESNSLATFIFTLDEIEVLAGKYYFEANASTPVALATLIDSGVKQFVAPFFGGFDGTNALLQNPFNEVQLGAGGSAQYSIESAIDMVGDRDVIRYDLISIPGVTSTAVNQDLVNQTEARGDALAIIDVAGIYQPAVDTGGTKVDQTIAAVTTEINVAALDSSYAAAYYPNVRLLDNLSSNGTVILMPPSVAAIGAIARSEADSQPWFAPAGFQRGGLSPLGGRTGAVVLGTVEHLTKADRDTLYQVNINPIARFPATGDTVIFGQKTLQQEASALDRINVRRLMNYLKKEIGDIADTILFDQNVQATWNRFKSRADIVLSQVKADFGITEYRLVLDETTTTPDLQDRNILYAKVFVKPARAIEFIAVDFVITQSGVEF
jgi:hypothetical protein